MECHWGHIRELYLSSIIVHIVLLVFRQNACVRKIPGPTIRRSMARKKIRYLRCPWSFHPQVGSLFFLIELPVVGCSSGKRDVIWCFKYNRGGNPKESLICMYQKKTPTTTDGSTSTFAPAYCETRTHSLKKKSVVPNTAKLVYRINQTGGNDGEKRTLPVGNSRRGSRCLCK